MNTASPNSKSALNVLVHEVSRLLKRRFEESAKGQPLTMTQWRALGQIALHPGTTQVAIASAIEADPMTVSGILDRLEKRGLIERSPAPGDSRAKCAHVTESGRQMFDAARAIGLNLFEAALTNVSDEDRAAAIRVLTQMRNNLTGDSAENLDV